jgi:capsular polysaccharide biosynthesis protein
MTERAIAGPPAQQDDHWIRPDPDGGNLASYLRTLWERRWLVCATVVACIGTALAVALAPDKEYTAHSRLLVTPLPQGDSNPVSLGLLRDSGTPDRDIVTATQLVTTRSVAARAARQLRLTGTPQQLLDRVRAEPVAQSNVLDIAARGSTPREAAALADAFASATIAERAAALRRQIDAATARVAAQIRSFFPRGDPTGTTRRELRRRAAELNARRAEPSPEFHPTGGAPVAPRASSPSIARAIGAAALIGLTLGTIAAFVRQAFDPRLRREAQVRELLHLPVLARVPKERAGRRKADPLTTGDLSPRGTEAYRQLRGAIEAVPGHWLGPRSVLIAGTAHGEGRTTTALNLASAFAFVGRSAILLEGDLRHPSAAENLAPQGPHTSGDVVNGSVSLEDALVAVGDHEGRLHVLAGAVGGPGAAEGFSHSAAGLLADAQSLADIVIVDAPLPADASVLLPLASHVDDIVLVARLGHTELPRLRELATMLQDHGLRPAGTVIIGVPPEDGGHRS